MAEHAVAGAQGGRVVGCVEDCALRLLWRGVRGVKGESAVGREVVRMGRRGKKAGRGQERKREKHTSISFRASVLVTAMVGVIVYATAMV